MSGPAAVRALGHVGDQDVGVQRWVAGAAAEGGADEAVGVALLDAPGATPDPAGVASRYSMAWSTARSWQA